MLTDLADAARKSGLEVVELPNWRTRRSNGGEDYQGVLVHHTGSYDSLTDAKNDYDYAMWMATGGRSDLPPPLCNLALSAECVVYVSAAGNANHGGTARASGPMPASNDGGRIYIGIEAMNSGSQGWDSTATTPDGERITYFEGYARLCAALCKHYGWPASHVRAHRETSVTGKWDPGLLDMEKFRDRIQTIIDEGDDMPLNEQDLKKINDAVKSASEKAANSALKKFLNSPVNQEGLTVRAALRKASDTKALAMEVRNMLREEDEQA